MFISPIAHLTVQIALFDVSLSFIQFDSVCLRSCMHTSHKLDGMESMVWRFSCANFTDSRNLSTATVEFFFGSVLHINLCALRQHTLFSMNSISPLNFNRNTSDDGISHRNAFSSLAQIIKNSWSIWNGIAHHTVNKSIDLQEMYKFRDISVPFGV